jgi:predicted ArsR family transcriptional regulator
MSLTEAVETPTVAVLVQQFVTSTTEPYSASDIAKSVSAPVAPVRTILRALEEQSKVERVATKRTQMRGRPSILYRTVR